jgi:hypothetical protein
MLITKLMRTDRTRADLYARGHQWPDLKLFDLSDLLEVGIDPDSLEIGLETPCRFWAIYELSDKLNKAGNPYKDVIALDPFDKPATVTSTDNSALLAELRTIRTMLEELIELWTQSASQAATESTSAPSELDRRLPRYRDGSLLSDNPAEQEAYHEYLDAHGTPPESVAALRQWVLTRQRNAD